MSNYRVDKQTGAVIFHKTPELEKIQELENRVTQLEKEIEYLKKCKCKRKHNWLRR